ncbi:MAG: hypothetical protein K8I60_12600 [Anaerolineae bacterium]|nr:hypothetical protein [Anaerolineae bacterium]
MSEITIVDNPYITVKYLDDQKIVFHTIHKPVGGQVFRSALNAGTEALKRYGASKWLSDDRLNGPVSDEDREWSFQNWNLPTIQAGWKYWALVVPTELIAADSLAPVIEKLYEYGLRMMTFSTVEAALEWLNRMPG